MKTPRWRFKSARRPTAVIFGGAVCVATLLFIFHDQGAFCEDSESGLAAGSDLQELNEKIQAGVGRAKPACVAVSKSRSGHAGFSAVIVGKEGYVLTAAHCMQPNRDYYLHLDDGRTLKAKSLGRSDSLDVGLMRIVEDAEFPWVEMGRSGELVSNQPCLSISHPGGLYKKRGLVVRYGRVVGLNARGHLHNTCLMEPGDSGGGLFDLEGRLIGIHSYINRSLSNNFDLPVDLFHTYWDALCEPKEFTPPYATDLYGVKLKSNAATEKGAEIASIVDDSPADKAGLQAGDFILSINGKKANAGFPIARELRRTMSRRGRELKLTVARDDQELAMAVKPRLPKPPKLAEGGSDQYDAWSDLAQLLAPVEDALDDLTVRIASRKADKTISVLGTVISQEGMILSKGSRVGRSPVVTDCEDRELAAEILGRDEENDLILLKVEARFERAVDLDSSYEVSTGLLLSPRPSESNGFVSVVGSARFASPPRKQYGYLGVRLGSQDKQVILTDVPEGPAKKAKLKQGDVILSVDDVLIDSVEKLINTIRSHDPGESVLITIERESKERSVEVALGTRPHNRGGHIAYQFAGGGSKRRTGFEEVFCHDAHVEPADCGGPLFDVEGNFAGLNIARVSRTHCYALPADVVREAVDRILSIYKNESSGTLAPAAGVGSDAGVRGMDTWIRRRSRRLP